MNCARCSGLMHADELIDIRSTTERRVRIMKCFNCSGLTEQVYYANQNKTPLRYPTRRSK